ncbi:TIGR03435 family protein [Granulicella sp. 5B5]|uniref:TIGR03435 family protein n=1 Tax=Granulicella sp. 5B5 TaxID=1617967 RepID=UPI002106AAD3|nr:TIGR03435 family protein [Granulicella sp. 5B5]
MLCLVACLALLGSVLHAQDITGNWQGTLKVQKDLRIILVIAKDNGALKGTMYSIDQGAQPIKASSISLDGSDFKCSVDLIGGTYEGKLSADGNTITGTWTQGPTPTPLVLARATKTTAWEIPAPPPPPKLMPADANPSFEVATIKPNDSGATSMRGLTVNGRNFRTRASSLEDLIAFSYQVQAKQIIGGPSWMSSDRYDIDAVPDVDGAPNPEQVRSMIRKLLTDRFQLKFHKDTRELSAFILSVDKTGSKLAPTQLTGPLPGIGMRPATGGLTLMVRNAAIPEFTGFLQSLVLDRPVVDKTGLKGKYDFTLTFLPDETQFNGHSPVGKLADGVEPAPSLTEAMQQQLGLKLSSEKTSVEVIALDHVEKPSAN